VQNRPAGRPDPTVEVPAASRVEVTFVMVESNITGTVVNLSGAPVAGARVVAWRPPFPTMTTSDELGHFKLFGMAPGDYLLSVARETAEDLDLGQASAHAVVAHTGDRDVKLVLPDAGSITGRVVLDGHPVDYFGVVLTTHPTATPAPRLAVDGRFVVVQAQSAEHGLALPRPLTAEVFDRDLELVMSATGSVAGSVSDDGPRGRHTVEVTSQADGRTYAADVDEGEFSIAQLVPGDYAARLDPVDQMMMVHVDANRTTQLALGVLELSRSDR
jgi:hypothetical protein